jgi:pimeloyl-ACP methyl ester carboxylesterase
MSNPMHRALAAAVLSLFMLAAGQSLASERTSGPVTNVVLVHGAFADGSSWAKVIPLLEASGLRVAAVQNPLTSFEDDVAATRRAVARMQGPVLLVGHSYGGAVITQAGNDAKVAGLVFVAAFAPAAGQSVGDVAQKLPAPPGMAEEQADAAGFLVLTEKGVNEDFAQDLSLEERRLIYATQGATALAAFSTRISAAAWKVKPAWYIVAGNDRMIAPQLEQSMAQQMKAKTTIIASSHVPMLSHAGVVADIIVQAAQSLKP